MAIARSLLFSTALLLGVVVINFERAESQCGGFQFSCQSISVGFDGVLTASCYNLGGTISSPSTLVLNDYIGVDNGVLVDGSGFVPLCQNPGSQTNGVNEDVFLQASCEQNDGTIGNRSSYDLSNNVVNSNGVLGWNNCR